MRTVRNALAEPHPLHLLELTSSLLSVTDPRLHVLDPAPVDPPLDELVGTFLEVDRPETTALLTVIAELSADDLQGARIRRELAQRRHSLPSWLERLHEAGTHGASEMVHLQRDGDNVMVGVQIPPSPAFTAIVYIDHNLGTLVKDAFMVPESLDDTEDAFRGVAAQSGQDAGMTIRRIDEADARVRITEAIALGAITYPPFESDTWPQCRPLLEWAVRMLPSGGAGYERHAWTDTERRELASRFFASPYGRALRPQDRGDHDDLLEIVLDFAIGYGTGDPLHWSPVAVEVILADWLPRKVIAPAQFLDKTPGLLRAFIAFCHAERGIPSSLTAETLDAVDHWQPTYVQLIRGPRPGTLGLLSAVGYDVGGLGPEYSPVAHWHSMIEDMRRQVGGADVLERLDIEPLPDEPFDWSAVADADRGRVTEVLSLCDAACNTIFDREHRTACRRLLAEVASGDPSMLTRSANPAYPAAAICWVIGKANDTFSSREHPAQVKQLMAALGLTGSVAERGYGMIRASGRPRPRHADQIDLGSTAFLVSAQRQRIIDRRDRFTTLLANAGADLGAGDHR